MPGYKGKFFGKKEKYEPSKDYCASTLSTRYNTKMSSTFATNVILALILMCLMCMAYKQKR